VDDLIAQLDSPDPKVQREAGTVLQEVASNTTGTSQSTSPPIRSPSPKLRKSSKARFMEREARKEEAKVNNYAPTDTNADARLAQEAKDEEKAIAKICNELGLQMHEIQPDGHCLFSAIGDQLALFSLIPNGGAPHVLTRRAAADYIMAHPDDFIPFLPCQEGEDGAGATAGGGFMSLPELQQYCLSIRDTAAWGGEPEILALSRAFNIPVHVVQWGSPGVVEHSPGPDFPPGGPIVYISYHRRMYGLGEHYNSLRPKSKSSHMAGVIRNAMML